MVQLGLIAGWASPNLERFRRDNSSIPLNDDQISWVGSLVDFGFFCGCLPGAISLSYFGSCQSLVNTLVPISLGWIAIIFANSAVWLYIGRLLNGFGVGMTFCIFPIFVGEVSIPETRGSMMFMAQIGFPVGMLIASFLDAVFSMTTASTCYLVFCISLMCVFFKLPESPYHLVRIGKSDSAKSAIDWYRSSAEVEKELESVEKFVASNEIGLSKQLIEFKKPQVRTAMYQVVVLLCFMQLCGLDGILFNMESILKRGKFEIFQRSTVVVFINAIAIIPSVISIFLIDRFGRRFLMVLSSTGVCISLLTMIIHFYLIEMDVDVTHFQWLPVISLALYISFIYVGIAPVPNTLMGEMLPSGNKYLCACFLTLIGALVAFYSAKSFQWLIDNVGDTYTYLIYMIFAVSIIPYVLLFMMETKGKGLQEIQEELLRRYS